MIPKQPFLQNGILHYPLDALAVSHNTDGKKDMPHVWAGTFTRENGVSCAPYDSLNVGFHVGDEPWNVRRNREVIQQIVNADSLVSACQSHGDLIVHVRSHVPEEHLLNVDGLITNVRGLALMIQHADCQAVGLYDPQNAVIANIHCGWRGCVNGIVKKAVQELIQTYHSDPAQLIAFISPSMGSCCGEFKGWEAIFPARFAAYRVGRDHFDLVRLTSDDLVNAGLLPANIMAANICTVCSPVYFSYRRERNTGRCATVIVLH